MIPGETKTDKFITVDMLRIRELKWKSIKKKLNRTFVIQKHLCDGELYRTKKEESHLKCLEKKGHSELKWDAFSYFLYHVMIKVEFDHDTLT